MPAEAEWLDARALDELEPALPTGSAACCTRPMALSTTCGCIEALGSPAVAHDPSVGRRQDTVDGITFSPVGPATGRSGATYTAERVVLAARARGAAPINGFRDRSPSSRFAGK